jgi:hypothetical protein
MSDIGVLVALGVLHFVIGGLWYSPLAFAERWMQGLGITHADIREARIDTKAAVAASALASFAQATVIILLLRQMPNPSVLTGSLWGLVIAGAFSFLPMLKDRVWADRSWSVILIDAGYELVAAGAVGALAVAWAA